MRLVLVSETEMAELKSISILTTTVDGFWEIRASKAGNHVHQHLK
jgi:hypothetical protein